jgi:thiamine-phosphate pyrophosphorylase
MAESQNKIGLTPAAQRTVARCRQLAAESARLESWVSCLVLTLLLDESLASACLNRLGITREWLIAGELGAEIARLAAMNDEGDQAIELAEQVVPSIEPLEAINDPLDLTRVLDRASEIARRGVSDGGISSINLLLAILETNDFVRERFAASGVTEDRVRKELLPEDSSAASPLLVDDDLVLSLREPDGINLTEQKVRIDAAAGSSDRIWRVVDANLNRAREGLRVLEDLARFVYDDDVTSLALKTLRHELVAAERCLTQESQSVPAQRDSLVHRNTTGDVGTSLSTSSERTRASLTDVVTANCRRVQESLRSLEEFGKLLSPHFASTIKQLRYRTYTIEKSLAAGKNSPGRAIHAEVQTNSTLSDSAKTPSSGLSATFSPWMGEKGQMKANEINEERQANLRGVRLQSASVYVLITESACQRPWRQVVELALLGGADVLQLREKGLNDRELLRRAVWIRDACRSAGALFIANDRPDIALASDADGVHVGQDEFSVEDVRRVLRTDMLVGVSTHDLSQARQAIPDGADYLGVGPVFPSQTKQFDAYPGLRFVRAVADSISIPWFAIGGVSLENLDILIAEGASRVAVTSAVTGSLNPSEVVRVFQQRLGHSK